MERRRPSRLRRAQRGAAALVVTMLLVLAMLLVAVVAQRETIVETRAAANHYRTAQSFEAAEAGLEWALARLNDGTPIGDDCLPSGDAGAASFRDRYLRDDGMRVGVATWNDAGTARPLQAACVHGDDSWSCRCPASGDAVVVAPEGSTTAPRFAVQFADGDRPGLVRAIATGCTRDGVPCGTTAPGGNEAAARLEVVLGLVPGLRAAPVAALTVVGNVDAGAGALGVHNREAASDGLALHAGGTITGDALRLGVPAGSPLEGAIVAGDPQLAALAGDRFFARWFGMDRAAWQAQPAATALACTGGCAGSIGAAFSAGARLVATDGDVALDGPLVLGTPERPIVLAVSGALRLRGAVVLHGVVVAGSLEWRDAPADAGALVRGAALVEGSYVGDAAADIVRDPVVLARLQRQAGSYARVNGSWKDF